MPMLCQKNIWPYSEPIDQKNPGSLPQLSLLGRLWDFLALRGSALQLGQDPSP